MVRGIHRFTGPRESISYDTLCSFLESYGTAQCSVPTSSVNSFVDSGATGEFINCYDAKSNQLHTRKLSEPILVYNVDRTLNEAGSITEVVDLILRYWNHSELFAVTGLGKQKLILGHSWLWKHNPEIDWVTGEVKMSRCPPQCCSGCRDEAQVERITRKAEIWWTEAVSDGPVPELHIDSKEEEPEEAEEPIKPGDCIFAIGLVPAPAEIQAVMNDNRWTWTRIVLLDSSHGWPISLLDPLVEWQRTTWLYPTLCLVIPFDSLPFPNTASFCDSYYSMTPILTHTTKPLTLDTAL